MTSLLELRDLALRFALECAPLPSDAQPRVHQARTLATSTKSSEVDLVTELDTATEAAIIACIRDARPDDGILGEEGGATTSGSGFTWVIDPIDGTVNYFFGSPQWCMSIGIVDADGVPVVGVVHAPALRETYVAARGAGAYLLLDGEQIDLTPPPEVGLDMALLATGFSYDRERRVGIAGAIAHLAPRVRDFRRAGAAALDICAVAAGRMHGYFERDLKPWDRAAAFVVAHEVGLATQVLGSDEARALTIVAPQALARTIREELALLGVVD